MEREGVKRAEVKGAARRPDGLKGLRGPFRLIALDVDGTLLTSAHTLSARVRRTVRAARARGIQVALATGKLRRSVADLIAELDLVGPQITCNGAAIVDAGGGPPLDIWPLEGEALALALEAIRAADPAMAIAWYTADAIYTDAAPGELDRVLAAYHEPPLIHVPALDGRVPTPTKLLVTGAPERLAALRAAVTPRVAGRVQVVTTTPDFLEFLSPDADKGRGLRAVMDRLGIPRAEVLALGDGENDIPLLAAAGTAVAMANAVPGLRARTQYITSSNDEDGVAVAIEAALGRGRVGRTVAVVLGAGQGTRMGGERNKVLLPLAGVPILARAIGIFERSPLVDEVLVVAHPAEVEECRELAARHGARKVVGVVPGGATRHQSEARALEALRPRIVAGEVTLILIHDGARPFVGEAELARLVAAAREVGAALLATPLAADAVVAEADPAGRVTRVFSAGEIWRAQTPQAFAARRLLAAYDAARRDGVEGTDTASALERLGERVRVVAGGPSNIKITTPDDLARAQAWIAHGRPDVGSGVAPGGQVASAARRERSGQRPGKVRSKQTRQ